MRRVRTLKRPYMIEQEQEKADEALERLSHWAETWFVTEAIWALREEDILLSDVHAMNLGFTAESQMVAWADGVRRPALLIFDPGHSSAPQVEVPRLP